MSTRYYLFSIIKGKHFTQKLMKKILPITPCSAHQDPWQGHKSASCFTHVRCWSVRQGTGCRGTGDPRGWWSIPSDGSGAAGPSVREGPSRCPPWWCGSRWWYCPVCGGGVAVRYVVRYCLKSIFVFFCCQGKVCNKRCPNLERFYNSASWHYFMLNRLAVWT